MSNVEEKKDQKCGRCKAYKYPRQFYNNTGRLLKTCGDCRVRAKRWSDKNKCEHNRVKSTCKECGGASICEHNREKSKCRECGGSSFCEHNRIKSACKDCGGGSICEHNRVKSTCKDCGGGSICEHNRQKSQCKECDFHGYLGGIVRGQVYRALKHEKELSSQQYLGCDTQLLKEHIENQWDEKMNWDNYGEWHIDHIKPLKYREEGELPSLEELTRRCHYTNLQPLWAVDNIAKGNRWVG